MIVEVKNNKYRVSWNYSRTQRDKTKFNSLLAELDKSDDVEYSAKLAIQITKELLRAKNTMITKCQIKDLTTEIIYDASVVCSIYDTFNKEKGRQLSLNRCLELHFNPEDRGLFLKTYYTRK